MFLPKLNVLPAAQRKLWSRLREVPGHFTLYGGTAIALQLGHRESVDFDFFSPQSFTGTELENQIQFLRQPKTVIQDMPNTYSATFSGELEGAKVSFFGALTFGQTVPPLIATDIGLRIAALPVMLAMKLKVVQERVTAKDYLDIAALLRAGIPLEEGLSHLDALFPNSVNLALVLQTLVYFHGGDLDTLPADVKRDLENAVKRVRDVPIFSGVTAPIGSGEHQ